MALNSSDEFDEFTSPPSRKRQGRAASRANGSRRASKAARSSQPERRNQPREDTPPRDRLDAEDRRVNWAMKSPDDLERIVAYERHLNQMKWHNALRGLVFYGGVLTLSVVFVVCWKAEGFPAAVAGRIVLYGSLSCISGYGLGSLVTKMFISRGGPRRARQYDQS
jgi:hypothetical protein